MRELRVSVPIAWAGFVACVGVLLALDATLRQAQMELPIAIFTGMGTLAAIGVAFITFTRSSSKQVVRWSLALLTFGIAFAILALAGLFYTVEFGIDSL